MDGPIATSGDVEINLNGHSITSDFDDPAFVANAGQIHFFSEGTNGSIQAKKIIGSARNGGTIVIEGGTYRSTNLRPFEAVGADSTVVMHDGELYGREGAIGAFDGASIIVNDGYMEVSDNFTLFTNGTAGRGGNTIVLNGGRLVGNITEGSISQGYHAIGVYIANNDTFIMNGGEIVANNGSGLVMRGGHVEIHDGSITATGEPGTTGKVGDLNKQMSKSAVIYDEAANYPGKEGMSLTITGGMLIGVDHSLEVLSNEVEPNVMVDGGEFEPPYPENIGEQGA